MEHANDIVIDNDDNHIELYLFCGGNYERDKDFVFVGNTTNVPQVRDSRVQRVEDKEN